jgi:hypothetical protein
MAPSMKMIRSFIKLSSCSKASVLGKSLAEAAAAKNKISGGNW